MLFSSNIKALNSDGRQEAYFRLAPTQYFFKYFIKIYNNTAINQTYCGVIWNMLYNLFLLFVLLLLLLSYKHYFHFQFSFI